MKNILVLLLLVLPECIWAQSYSVKKLGAMEGLSNNNVLSMLKINKAIYGLLQKKD